MRRDCGRMILIPPWLAHQPTFSGRYPGSARQSCCYPSYGCIRLPIIWLFRSRGGVECTACCKVHQWRLRTDPDRACKNCCEWVLGGSRQRLHAWTLKYINIHYKSTQNDNIGLTNLMGEGMIDFIPPQTELQEISPGTGSQCFVSFVFVVLGAQGWGYNVYCCCCACLSTLWSLSAPRHKPFVSKFRMQREGGTGDFSLFRRHLQNTWHTSIK